jgi:8-oxo-dGTP diphosphatase
MPSRRTILAAGGVVWRRAESGLEIALVHRPRYDDWSLPKGKLYPGESELAAAVREVSEELGVAVAVSRRIGTVKYPVIDGRKKVTYWAMLNRGGDFEPTDEVDDVEWLPVAKARKRLSYDIDRAVVRDFAALPAPDSVLVLLRHAKAGKRSDWHGGDDALRPLDANGVVQAAALAELLTCFAPDRIYSADRVRCVQTVEPLAAALDVQVRVEPAFADEAFVSNPSASQIALLALAKPGKVSVVCSQGVTVPALVDRLGPGTNSSDTRKGAWWVLTLTDGDVVTADYYDAP